MFLNSLVLKRILFCLVFSRILKILLCVRSGVEKQTTRIWQRGKPFSLDISG